MQHFNYNIETQFWGASGHSKAVGGKQYDTLPGSYLWKQCLLESSIPEYNILGETMIIANDYHHYDNISEHDVIGAGTHAFMGGVLSSDYLDMGRWHQSKQKVSGHNPYAGYLTNKK